jgi:hypothetical protein
MAKKVNTPPAKAGDIGFADTELTLCLVPQFKKKKWGF